MSIDVTIAVSTISIHAILTMFEGLLLLISVLVAVGLECVDVQAHVPGNASLSYSLWEAGLGVDNGGAALSGLNELRILFLEDGKVPLSLPVPDAVGGKEQVHFFKCALVGFGVQAVDHGQGNDVGNAEDVVGLLLKSLENDGKKECQPAIANGPANDTPSITLSTYFQGENLSRVQPWNSEPGSTECRCEEEDHGNSARASAASGSRALWMLETDSSKSTSEEHRDALDNGAPIQCPTTTDPVQSEDTNESSHLHLISTDSDVHGQASLPYMLWCSTQRSIVLGR